jgi:hypothetical protein
LLQAARYHTRLLREETRIKKHASRMELTDEARDFLDYSLLNRPPGIPENEAVLVRGTQRRRHPLREES